MPTILRYCDGVVSEDYTFAIRFDGTKLEKDENTIIFDRSKGKNFIWSKTKNKYVLLSSL